MVPAFIGVPGGMELMIILAIVILFFGANKLPELARSSGQAIGEFRKGQEEIETKIRGAETSEQVSDEREVA